MTADTSILDLPSELMLQILGLCDFRSILSMRATCRFLSDIAQYHLSCINTLDVRSDYCEDRKDPLRMEKLAHFIKLALPSLTTISFRGTPTRLSLCNLIQLSWATPRLVHLDISQDDISQPEVDPDAFFAVPYFKKLMSLRISGWSPMQGVRRGCCHRDETSLVHQLTFVKDLSMETPDRWLSALKEARLCLPGLKKVSFGARNSNADFVVNLLWFLSVHRDLRVVNISHALFTTNEQVDSLYKVLCSLPLLQELRLQNCSCVDAVTKSQYEQQLVSRVKVDGNVRSHRYSPYQAN